MDTVNIKYIILVMMVLIASAEKQVKLKLKTTHCKNSCTHFHHKMCPSSIMVDNRERSSRKDGFNIVVINNYSGRVVARKYLQWFSNLMFWRKAEFKNFFQTIRHNSTVIIVFQNMCKSLETDWYTILSDLDHSITKRLYSSQAAIIACKGSCPDAVDEKIPYTYYSSGVKFEKDITLIFRGVKVRKDAGKDRSKKKDFIAESVGGIVGIVFFLAIIYSIYVYCKRKATLKEAAMFYKTTEQNACTPHDTEPEYEPLSNFNNKENVYEVVEKKVPPPYNYNYQESERTEPSAPPLSDLDHYSHMDMESHKIFSTSNVIPPAKLIV